MCIARLAILGYSFKMYSKVKEIKKKTTNKQVNVGLYAHFIYHNIFFVLLLKVY